MRFMIKEKFWSFGNDFNILDQNGDTAFIIDGKAFSWGDKLSFQNTAGQELAYISQKLLSLKPKYEIYRAGKLWAEVVKEYSWFRQEFTLDVPGPNDYSIKGSFWKHDYEFIRGGQVVAKISKDIWALRDCYGVEIIDGEDEVSILCAAIVIDQVLHNENDD